MKTLDIMPSWLYFVISRGMMRKMTTDATDKDKDTDKNKKD
jgi:hypothetical protein